MKKVVGIIVVDCLLICEFLGLDVQRYTFCCETGKLSLLHVGEWMWMNIHESLSWKKVLHVILSLKLSLLVI